MKIFVLIGLFFCMKAFAGYECELTLSRASESQEAIAFDILKAQDSDLGSKNIENFFEESDTSILSLSVFMDGWKGEEEATITVIRKSENQAETISEKLSLRGDAQESIWFDDYKLEANCSL